MWRFEEQYSEIFRARDYMGVLVVGGRIHVYTYIDMYYNS
jgi:hypothetical protein